jgi:hypothetical protein
MKNLTGVVRLLKREQDRLTKELHGISAALAAFGKTYTRGMGTRKLSASARARIAAAQRTRWAKFRANAEKSANSAPITGKRTLSPASRKKIAAAQKSRGARGNAGKKAA